MATIANLDINMGARIERLSRGMKQGYGEVSGFVTKSLARLKSFQQRASKSLQLSRGGQIVGGLAAAGAAYLGVSKSVESFNTALARGDNLAKTADKLGTTTVALQRLRLAAITSAEVSEGQFDVALQRMTRRVSQAASGTGEAVKVLDELGLSAKELNSLSPDQQFLRISDAMQNVSNQGDRVRLTFGLFDSEGVNLVNTLRMGSEAITQAGSDIDKYGLALSRIDTAQIEQANDSFTKLQAVTNSLWDKIAAEGAPILTSLIGMLLDGGEKGETFGDTVSLAMDGIVVGVGFVGDGINFMTGAFQGAQAIVTGVIGGIVKGLGMIEQALVKIGGSDFDFGINQLGDDLLGEAGRLLEEGGKSVDRALTGSFSQDLQRRINESRAAAQKTANDAILPPDESSGISKEAANGIAKRVKGALGKIDIFGTATAAIGKVKDIGSSIVDQAKSMIPEAEKFLDNGPEALQRGSAGALSAVNSTGRQSLQQTIQAGNQQLVNILQQLLTTNKSIDKKTATETILG